MVAAGFETRCASVAVIMRRHRCDVTAWPVVPLLQDEELRGNRRRGDRGEVETRFRFHSLRFHGLLAPHSAWRSLIVPRPDANRGAEASAGLKEPPPAGRSPASAGSGWAALLKRVFAVDRLHCPRWGGRRRIVAVPTRPETLRPLLARLGLGGPSPCAPPARSPPRPAA